VSSIFSQIISGEIPCYKIAEDDNHIAFLDIFPISKGHILVVPKKETDYIFDLNSKAYSDLWLFAKKVAIAQKKVIKCNRIGVSVVGLEVPHAHIHLIPINNISDMDFSKPKLKLSSKEFSRISRKIAELF
tara:strand:- start:3149 stop:3541 length:393 start_codon:yes stop_codon:yes gene_type:complete